MICPVCQYPRNEVVDNRSTEIKIWRRHKCLGCKHSWHSIQIPLLMMKRIIPHIPSTSEFLEFLDEMKRPTMNAAARALNQRKSARRKEKRPRIKKLPQIKRPQKKEEDKELDRFWYLSDTEKRRRDD